ncbi:hypothetical protein T11_11817, partial [Trichinella zimbabwensis]
MEPRDNFLNLYIYSSTEIRTRIAGFKVQSASRYTMEPSISVAQCYIKKRLENIEILQYH